MSMNFSHGADMHVEPVRHTNFHASHRSRHGHQGSMSGPDDSSYASFSDAFKGETDTDDENTALTSQTLNTDGTPKRPMNAFMIFARRRRPQVSAANQSMRTGEISKILSKEWNSMQSIEKQFYQDQAKQLKDTFNMRYPDYVYRRRPNNSRRKRKPDGSGVRQVDRPVSLDTGDDVSGPGESLTDEDIQEDLLNSPEVQNSYSDHSKFALHPRPFSYAYPETNYSLHSNQSDLLYGQDSSGVERLSNGLPLPTSVVPPQLTHSLPYPHRSQSYSAQLFDQEYGGGTYETPVARPVPWPLGSGYDRNAVPKSHSFSTSAKRLAWPRPTSVANKPMLTSSTYVLPTLNSPFYPNQTSSQSSVSSSTSSPHSASQSPFNSGMLSSSPKTDQNIYGYSSSPSCSPAGVTSGREASLYPRRITNSYFSHFHPPSHSSLQSSGLGAPQVYWSGLTQETL